MNRNIFLAGLAGLALSIQAAPAPHSNTSGFAGLVDSIVSHNLSIQVAALTAEADAAGRKAENRLGMTDVEFSPFFEKGTSGVASTELIVSQEFDFPSLYSARKDASAKQNSADRTAIEMQAKAMKSEVSQLLLQHIYLMREQQRIQLRSALCDSLQTSLEKMLDLGDATSLDYNNLMIEEVGLQNAQINNQADLADIQRQLAALNGGLPVECTLSEFPSFLLPDDAEIERLYVEGNPECVKSVAEAIAAQAQISVNAREALPKFTLGYRMNTERRDVINGILVGVSLPIFSGNDRKTEAKLRNEAALLAQKDAQESARFEVESLLGELHRIQALAETYDHSLVEQTRKILLRSLELRQITFTEYLQQYSTLVQAESDHDTIHLRRALIESKLFYGL